MGDLGVMYVDAIPLDILTIELGEGKVHFSAASEPTLTHHFPPLADILIEGPDGRSIVSLKKHRITHATEGLHVVGTTFTLNLPISWSKVTSEEKQRLNPGEPKSLAKDGIYVLWPTLA